MTAPRDIELNQWLDGTRHHPPKGESTVLAHEAARNLIGQLGISMFQLLPAGRDKSLVFTALEDALMRANRAIALHGGPDVVTDDLRRVANAYYPMVQDHLDKTRGGVPADVLDQLGKLREQFVANLQEVAGQDPLPDVDPDEERLHKGERKPTFRSTVRGISGTPQIELSAEQVAPAEGYIQLGVLAKDDEAASRAIADDGFRGFYATITSAEEWATLMTELASAGAHVWGHKSLSNAVG